MNSSPYTSQILNQILEAKGELSERTAQPLLVRALRTLDGRAQLRERCEATWNACYPDRRKWADIGEGAQAEWLRVFEVFDSLSTPNRSGSDTRTQDFDMTQEPLERCLHPACSPLVLFHGSPVEIKDVALAAGTWLTPSVDMAREYGEFIYRVELSETHRGIADGPNWEGHFVTLGHIPWRHVELMANAELCRPAGGEEKP